MADSHHFELFIGGADAPATGGGRLEVRSPATGEIVGSVADGSAADADRAVAAAAEAFGTWSAL
ncbi:MAG TPA: aldehyde dehydrogenase family protein, partial [Opitutaceae bacterium]